MINNANHEEYKLKNMFQYEKVAFFSFILLSLEYVIHYYINIGQAPKILIYVNAIIAVFLPLYGIVTKKKTLSSYSCFLLFYYTVILLYTVVLALFSGRASRDIVCITIYIQILDAILYQDLSLDFINKLFRSMAIIAFFGFLYSMSKISLNVSFAINRGYQYDEIFYYSSLFWFTTPYVFLSLLKRKDVLFATVSFSLYMVLELVIVKRIVLVTSLVTIIVCLFILNSKKNKVKQVLSIITVLAFVFLVFRMTMWNSILTLFNSVLERTVEATENIGSFNRFEEAINFLKEASIIELFLGRGFGGTHMGLGSLSEALHVGWVNFILKGGINLLFLFLIPYIKLINLLRIYNTLPEKVQFSIWYMIYMFPILFLSNMHAFYPQLFLFVFCLIQVMNYKSSTLDEGYNGLVGIT